MRLHFARVPIEDSGAEEERLNRFLATHRILAVDRHLVVDGARSSWALCITYDEHVGDAARAQPVTIAADGASKKSRVDYRDVLSPPQFDVFVRLRALRKELAERDAIPLYAVFTNDQLAAMVRTGVTSLAELARIEGVGPARLEKYGRRVLEILAQPAPPADDADGDP